MPVTLRIYHFTSLKQENNHRLTTVMYPDDEYEIKRQKREEDLLNSLTSRLSATDITDVQRKGRIY